MLVTDGHRIALGYALPVATKKMVKRTRRTRDEGKQLLLMAAENLLQTTDPDDLGIRDIGALAEVHHRLVA